MNNANIPKRWYDRQPKLAQAVRFLFLLPDEINHIICEGMVLIANRQFQVNEQMNSFRTLGTDKVLGLYKSKNKRREYDQNDLLHKSMNYLYIMSEENQDVMADHVLNLVQYIQSYLSTCQVFHQPPTSEDIGEITSRYIEKGSDEVEAFLNRVREEFYQKMLQLGDEAPIDFLEDVMQDETISMKLRQQSE